MASAIEENIAPEEDLNLTESIGLIAPYTARGLEVDLMFSSGQAFSQAAQFMHSP